MITTIDHGAVRELRMSRPPANALSPELVAALSEALDRAPQEGVRAIVLSGLPGIFSAGLDVPYLLTLDREAIGRMWRSFYGLLHRLAASPVPVVAAITGHSPAGGAVLALFCDDRVMAEGDFRIGLNEVQVGIPIPTAIHRALVRLVGSYQAERLCVSSLLVPPAEALRLGLVEELAPPDQVVARAVERCEWLLKMPPRAMSRTREITRADLVRLVEEGLAAELDGLADMWFSEETQATLRAVMERLAKKKG
ncbi:MAG TPA: enoyl-CoA hydratase/isomerase family protein [Thermoanaerobaculia bacterium]